MTTLLPADPVHGVRLPRGDHVATLLRRLLSRIGQDARTRLRGPTLPRTPPDLSRWLPVMRELLAPLVAQLLSAGARTAAARLRRRKTVSFAFDLLDPRVLQAADELTLALCRSTLATVRDGVADALAATREQLHAGLARGETYRDLSRRLGRVFDDPFRAARVGVTEASRSTHAGQALAGRELGTAGLEWLASADACTSCLALSGKRVRHGEPFVVLDRGNPAYRVVYYPPLHPFCMCSASDWVE